MDCCFWSEAYNGAYITKKKRKKHMKKQGNLLMKLTDLAGLTFLWIIGCIPIVTLLYGAVGALLGAGNSYLAEPALERI